MGDDSGTVNRREKAEFWRRCSPMAISEKELLTMADASTASVQQSWETCILEMALSAGACNGWNARRKAVRGAQGPVMA